VEWLTGDVPPAEVSPDEPVVRELLRAGDDLGRAV